MVRRKGRCFTGCWRCRKRKVKCDENKPSCLACARIGATCTGYRPRLVWSESDDSAWKSDGRRAFQCESTWAGFPVLSSYLVDRFISECDEEAAASFRGQTSSKTPCHNPFAVFQITLPCEESLQTRSNSITRGLSPFSDTPSTEVLLFHHYVNHVAAIMMPYDHPRNPWMCEWPATALYQASKSDKALYNVLLAHSAFHLANLCVYSDDMVALGSKHYVLSIRDLRDKLSRGFENVTAVLATVMTLIFAEAYSGQQRTWRSHLQAALTLLEKHYASEPWNLTNFGRLCFQSLSVIKTIVDTSQREVSHNPHHVGENRFPETRILMPISSTADFGFTIGAPREILECIARITELRDSQSQAPGGIDEAVEVILSELNECRRRAIQDRNHTHGYDCGGDGNNDGDESETVHSDTAMPLPSETLAQTMAFVQATYVYLYRSLFNAPPCSVRTHVSRTLREVTAFFASSCGNFSLWPAFIAAAEAYTDEDLAMAKNWLSRTMSFGLGSRKYVKEILEEVWRRRDACSREWGLSPDMIAIDWKAVMHELDYDVLLV